MTERERIEGIVLSFIRRELVGTEELAIDPDESLFAAGYVDSVGIMRLIAYVETTLQLRIPPTDLVPEHFRTVRAMAAYLDGRTRAAVRSATMAEESQSDSV